MGQFSSTVGFLENYFYGGGIGWWLAFFLVVLIVIFYIYYDSSRRNLQDVVFWRIAIIVALILMIPTILFRFTVKLSDVIEYFETQAIIDHLVEYQDVVDWRVLVESYRQFQLENFPLLTGYFEIIVYLGIIAGIGALGLGIGYWLTYKDEKEYSSVQSVNDVYIPPSPVEVSPVMESSGYRSTKPKVNAWLIMKSNGKNYQLNKGTTTIGRSSKNDIPIINDRTVSNQHVKIIEENGRFKLVDLGSLNGTWINGNRVRQPTMLDLNDEIRVGDNTYMKFMAS
jgi:hypothetical protein